MQQIERYGAIALVFIVVTFFAVFLWESDASEEEAPTEPQARGRIAVVNETGGEPFRLPRQIVGSERERRELPLSERSGRRGQTGRGQRRGPNASQDESSPVANQAANQAARDVRAPREVPADRVASTPAGGRAMQRPEQRPVEASTPRAEPIRTQDARRNQGQRGAPMPVELQRPGRDGTIRSERSVAATVRSARTSLPRTAGTVSVDGSAGGRRSSVKVRAGDTLERIARRELGDGGRWREIQALNGNIDPRRLGIGMRLELPTGAPAAPATPAGREEPRPSAARSGRTYVVKSGDMLSRIAQRELGSAKLWPEIVAVNPGIDPDRIFVGSKLALPGVGAPELDRVVAQATPAEDSRFRVR